MSRRSSDPHFLAQRVLRGSAAGVGLHGAHLALRFVVTPVVIARAGFGAFGLWSLVFVTFGALGLHRSGLAGATGAVVSRHVAAGDRRAARRVLATSGGIGLGLGALVLLIGGGLAAPLAAWMGAPQELESGAAWMLGLVALGTAIQLASTPLQASHEALQRHAYLRVAEIGCQMLESGSVLVALVFFDGAPFAIQLLGGAFAARTAILAAVHVLTLARSREGRVLLVAPDWPARTALAELAPLGLSLQLLGTVHLAVMAVPRMVVARFLGLAATGAFEAGRKLVELSASLPGPAVAPLGPAAAALTATEDPERPNLARARGPLRFATRMAAVASALPLAVLFAAASPIAAAWLGDAPGPVVLTLRILIPAAALHMCTGPVTAVLRGIRRPGAELRYSAIWLAVLLALVPAGASWGLAGALVGTAVAQALASAWLLVAGAREVGLAPWALLIDASRGLAVGVLAAAVGGLCASTVSDALTRTQALTQTAGIAGITLMLGLGVAYGLALDPTEQDALFQRRRRISR